MGRGLNSGTQTGMRRCLGFLAVLLERRRSNSGFIRVEAMAEKAGVSRATAYRYVAHAEAAGFPIERDGEGGVRCMWELRTKQGDPVEISGADAAQL